MSNFGTSLDEIIRRKNITAVDLSKLSGVGEPMISRYRKGDQVWVSPGDLTSLAKAVSDKPTEQAELVRAHLLDEIPRRWENLIQIEILGETVSLKETAPPYQVKLPKDLEDDFAIIRQWVIKDKNVRDIIESLGNFLRTGTIE